MKMTKKEYDRERNRIVNHYERIRVRYIREQMSGDMLTALQHEKNERLIAVTEKYYGKGE